MDSEEQQRTTSVDEAVAGFATEEGAGTTRSASSNPIATPTPAPSSQTPGHPSFRRQRASRACEVRCDAASLGVPCTNCTAFSIECKIPAPKRQKIQKRTKDGGIKAESQDTVSTPPSVTGESAQQSNGMSAREKFIVYNNSQDGTPSSADKKASVAAAAQYGNDKTFAIYLKPQFTRAPIKDAGRVAFLGESSNLSLLVHDNQGTKDVVHYPLPENVRGAKARVNELDNLEIQILHQRGAFLLPPRSLCDELVEAFFTWVAPVVPVINQSKFMAQYKDPKNPPSFLLLQAVLLAGSRVCSNPQLMDVNGSTTAAAMTFFKRAKALFDANYEDDRVTIVQSLVLMGWYWEGPEDVTKNVFYWTRLAIVVAQGSGMHRSVENSQLSSADKKLWKRIWWTLFARDRSCAVALGRPIGINPDDSDVEMVSEDDFNDEEDTGNPPEYPPDPIHVQFFLNYVKLCEIMGLVLSQQYSVASKLGRNAMDLTHSDMALADWLQNCPKEVSWDRQRHHFWAALLYSNYYTTICLLHRAHMPPAGSTKSTIPGFGPVEEPAYPSRRIAYHAAGMITSIIECLQAHDQLRYTPAFIVYCLFSALIMHVYQMRSSDKSIVSSTEQRLQICMNALKDVSRVWLVAKMVHSLFESILGNKALVERLQKAAGKKHNNSSNNNNNNSNTASRQAMPAPKVKEEAPKRKFDEMDFTFSNGTPSQQVSYERSRPQTPAFIPPQMPQQHDQMAAPHPGMSPALRHNHELAPSLGNSRSNTRPGSPFFSNNSNINSSSNNNNNNNNSNPNGYPSEPPDLFLVTRNSPNISESFWHNFQPDQLFPAEANVSLPLFSPLPQSAFLDPQLQNTGLGTDADMAPGQGNPMVGDMSAGGGGASAGNMAAAGLGVQQGVTGNIWSSQYDGPALGQQGSATGSGGSEDSWSNKSQGNGPIVPTTLNVEDWFNFFGINGESNGLAGSN